MNRDEPAYRYTVERKALVESVEVPARSWWTEDGTLVLDFGKAAFGTLLLPEQTAPLTLHLGERADHDGRVDRTPPGTVRYREIRQEASLDKPVSRIAIPPDERNTGSAAIRMPTAIGEVLPFRYAEIEAAQVIDPDTVRRTFVHYPFDDSAAWFRSSDEVLNAVWDLCKYTIKATSFCGIYVDGDRERIPYEGDAYINQLSHYGVDQEYSLARYSMEYLIQHPTSPTEWHLHCLLMAWADYLYTGETGSLEEFYGDLRVKTLVDLADADGLISVASPNMTRALEEQLHLHWPGTIFKGLHDLVDWPPASFTEGGFGERDGFEMRPVNAVVNAFHYRALVLFSRIAQALGQEGDATWFSRQAVLVRESFLNRLFDPGRGLFVDGVGATHTSLHGNLFPLVFGLVRDKNLRSVIQFIKSRGMACSVYGAQYLLEALYKYGEAEYALSLMTAQHDRSWWNMISSGGTIAWEAWDWKFKNNLDWNHAWGAAPANIIPRFLLGVRPMEPGFGRVLIHPQPAGIVELSGKVPTPRGPIEIAMNQQPGRSLELELTIPETMLATVRLPWVPAASARVLVNGSPVSTKENADYTFSRELAPLRGGRYHLRIE